MVEHTIIHGSSETIMIYFIYQISTTILVKQTDPGLNLCSVRLANPDFCLYTAWVQNQYDILGYSYTMMHKYVNAELFPLSLARAHSKTVSPQCYTPWIYSSLSHTYLYTQAEICEDYTRAFLHSLSSLILINKCTQACIISLTDQCIPCSLMQPEMLFSFAIVQEIQQA